MWLSWREPFLLTAGVATRADLLAEGVRFKGGCLWSESQGSLFVLLLLRLEAEALVDGGEAPGALAIKGLGLSYADVCFRALFKGFS